VFFSKVFEGRIDTTNVGGLNTYFGRPVSAGSYCKVAQVMIEVVQDSGPEVRIKAELEQGPNGDTWILHSTPITSAAPPALKPSLMVGDADETKILGEYLRVNIEANSNEANPQWAFVKVYLMRKPF